ncbi:hypothetical protein [Pseudoclavibacter sp. CFCC 13796]|uniref:hypothetical protein n=1 Tax=Pseudoclavibacter sp. CFCC 13796 TaxID=2615179 RepID=UPI001787C9D6|nr:hypothetical protein [Pseudoclavibacter sp. CFCC 13796]
MTVCASLSLTGCGTACSAVGYMQTLTVHVEDEAGAVQKVRVCGGGNCPDDATLDVDPNIVSAEKSSDEVAVWTATLSYPEEPLLVQLIGSDGSVLEERLVSPDWRLTGGNERCGGPAAAEVTLRP